MSSGKKAAAAKKELSPREREELVRILEARFGKHEGRHKGIEWAQVRARLDASPEKMWSLNEMETSGGAPGLISTPMTMRVGPRLMTTMSRVRWPGRG